MNKIFLTQKQKEIYEILLTPIICDKKSSGIEMKNGIIYSGQKYIYQTDEDISDFTIGFYEIIYNNILDKKILDEEGKIINKEFSGDTMNSFNVIANRISVAGKTKKERTTFDEWPSYLQKYYYQYHCLANFWIIPMQLGRTSMKANKYDSTHIFLNMLKNDYDNMMKSFTEYTNKINDFNTFCKIHFINEIRDDKKIKSLYHGGDNQAKLLIKYANNDMKERAYKIATSEYGDKLYDYFKRCIIK